MSCFIYFHSFQAIVRKERFMTQVRIRAQLSLAIWCTVAVGFVVSFVIRGGPATYADEPMRILTGALFLGFGFLAYPLMLWGTRSRHGARPVVVDERDEWISLRASRSALVAVLVIVFFACICLWVVYRDEAVVPVGWMWFLGYSTAILGYLAQSVATLVIDLGADDRG
jgi:uncharacterized membrane protein YidH (DUF202 family)